MTTPAIAISRPTGWTRSLAVLVAAVVVALVVTVSLALSNAGQSAPRVPALHVGQAGNASTDCLFRQPGRPC